MNQLLLYSLPVANIEEVTITHDNLNKKFCSYGLGTYKIFPKKPEDLGTWRVSGIASNKWGKIKFGFKIKVTNDPPRLSEELVKIINATREIFQTFKLPLPSDPEGQSVSVKTYEKYYNKLPLFVTFN